MRTVAGTRAFNIGRDMPIVADTFIRQHVLFIAMIGVFIVEVSAEEITGVVCEDRI